MRGRKLVIGLVVVALGCSPDVERVGAETESEASGGEGGAAPGVVLLLLDVAPQPLCDAVGVVEVQLVAQQIGCESPPPVPCTMPSEPPAIEGDRLTCPSTDRSRLLGVQVTRGGRYLVQSTVRDTTGQVMPRCHALDGDPEVLVTAEELEVGTVKMLDDGDAPCP